MEGKRITVVGVLIILAMASQYMPIAVEPAMVERKMLIPLLFNNSNIDAEINAPIIIKGIFLIGALRT